MQYVICVNIITCTKSSPRHARIGETPPYVKLINTNFMEYIENEFTDALIEAICGETPLN